MREPAWIERSSRIDQLVKSETSKGGTAVTLLAEIIKHALDTVPFYRELPATPDDGDPIYKLRSFPVVKSKILRENLSEFVSEGAWVRGLYARTTSGTTGPATVHLQSLDDEYVSSCAVRGRIERQHGLGTFAEILDLSPRRTNARGEIVEPVVSFDYTGGKRMIWKLRRFSRGNSASIAEYQRFGRKRFDIIFGAPSRVEAYIKWCLDSGHKPRPKLVVCTFEELLSSAVDRFRMAFNCPIVNLYGSTESGYVGYSTDGVGPLCVQSDLCAVEVLKLEKDEPASAGELGRIIVTSFSSWAMPIIRYDTGDLGSIGEIDKRLGAGFAYTLADIDGRRSVTFVTRGGQQIGAGRIFEPIKRIGVWPFQFVQREPGRLLLRLGLEVPFHVQEQVCERLRLEEPDLFCEMFHLDLEATEFEYTRVGKFQRAVQGSPSEVPLVL